MRRDTKGWVEDTFVPRAVLAGGGIYPLDSRHGDSCPSLQIQYPFHSLGDTRPAEIIMSSEASRKWSVARGAIFRFAKSLQNLLSHMSRGRVSKT